MIRFTRRMALLAAPLLISVLLIACGGDDDDGGSGSGATAATGPEAPAGDTGAAMDDGAAISGEGFTQAELQELSEIEVAGYTRGQPVVSDSNVILSYTAESGDPALSAIVNLEACNPFICWDLGSELTTEEIDNLKRNLAPVHIDNPDLIFEYGTFEIASSVEAFYTYSRSFVAEGGSKAAVNSLTTTYHDGANSISILVAPEGGFLPDTADEWFSYLDQAGAQTIASEIFAAFQPEFSP